MSTSRSFGSTHSGQSDADRSSSIVTVDGARVAHHEPRAVGFDDGGELVERRLRGGAELRHALTTGSCVGTARCGSRIHDCAMPGPPAATIRMFAGDASDRFRSNRPVVSAVSIG